jgi:hypothetical protein
MHESDTTQASGRGKTGYVTNYAAANGDQQGVPIYSCANQGAREFFDGGKIFCGLSVIYQMLGVRVFKR